MKVLHVPFCYYPDAVGGTEIYVASLARAQRALGYEVAIAAPDAQNGAYSHDGINVHRFATAVKVDRRELYGEGDPEAAANFLKILECTRPDILHLHALTSGVSVLLARAARARGIPVVFTYHTPTITCMRGTMMRWGTEVCDGEMRVGRCTSCMLHGKGIPLMASWALGRLPGSLGALAGNAGKGGGFWTAVRATELVGLRHSAARQLLLAETDHVVAVCSWVRDALLANGVASSKITLCRQGLPYAVAPAAADSRRETPPVRFAFLGRLDAVKGLHILIEAFRQAPQLNAALDVFAVMQDENARQAQKRMADQIAGDRRVRFLPPLAAAEVVERLRSYDALLVPSQWLETGPLVVYEAFAAGIPVIGSNLGGIAELVLHGANGLLVGDPSAAGWAQALRQAVDDPELLPGLRRNVGAVRTMQDVANEMEPVYAAVVRRGREPEPLAAR